MQKFHAALLSATLMLAACAGPGSRSGAPENVCPACPSCPPATSTQPELPAAKPLQSVNWDDLPGWRDDDPRAAWPTFLQSCRGLAGTVRGANWKRVCDLAKTVDNTQAPAVRRFFEDNFQPYAVVAADGKSDGLITGYYEPLLKGSRTRGKAFANPVLGVPDDLLTVDLGSLYPELKHLRLRGRLQGNKVVPYYSRAEITGQADKWTKRTLLWVEDAVELFFLQVQGSGRVQLPDGKRVRLNYADQNGYPYQSIGRLLVERGEMKPEEASMQGIQAWGRAHPDKLPELLNANASYVFFREMPDSKDGPVGALGVPLTAERSLAVDPRTIPLGAPVFVATTLPNASVPLNRLMMAQDTGGAIKGAVRADFFWGFGKSAGEQAGRMRQAGRLWVLLPAEAAPK